MRSVDDTDEPIRIVAIDDDPGVLDLVEAILIEPGLEVLRSEDPLEGWDAVQRLTPDIVVLDLSMPRMGGMDLLQRIVDWNPAIDVVLLTGEYSTKRAVEAIQKGACDYFTKPMDVPEFQARIGTLIDSARQRRKAAQLERDLLETSCFMGMIGRSPEMLEVFALLRRIAPHFSSVLITGATGTGKELAARALHSMSPFANQPFVVCNCAAVVDTLFESELFGHVKGAFTGAVQDHVGLFEAAEGGTLFLDEIGEIPIALQGKLLRALQQKEIQRVGSSHVRRVSVKVIAATNRDLRACVAEKTFRDDLYFRVAMVEVRLPRLADRREDLTLLEAHFLEKYSREYRRDLRGISRRAQLTLSRCSWPGNVRQLENAIGHACMMARGDVIDVRDLPEYLRAPSPDSLGGGNEELLTLAEMQKRHARFVLAKVDGNKQQAAEVLGVSRTTLYKLLEEDSA